MADKKVDRNRPNIAADPSKQMNSSLSNSGTINMADSAHDKGRSALLDKFRRREERWRREQSLHDREVLAPGTSNTRPDSRKAGPVGAGGPEEGGGK